MKLKRGDLPSALAAADSALQQYSSAQEAWHWRFTVLKAEILMLQHRNKESLALLAPPLPDFLADSDVAVRQKLTQSMSNAFMRQTDQANLLLNEAEILARARHPELLAEVALRKGRLAVIQAEPITADREFRETLRLARDQKDPFLEVAALGSLGWLATINEHYDEAIDWNGKALSAAQSAGAQGSIVKIGNNMGWGYLEVGDFDSALTAFRQSADAAVPAGLLSDQAEARSNIGNVQFAKKNFAAARSAYEGALTIAKELDDPETLVECYLNLAFVALREGQLLQAKQYQNQFARLLQQHPSPTLQPQADLIAGWLAQSLHDHKQAEVIYQKVVQNPNSRTQLRWEAELHWAQLYVEEGEPAEADREFRRCIELIEKARGSFKKEELQLSFLSDPISAYDAYIEFLISQGREKDALGIAELSRARTLAEGLSSKIKYFSLAKWTVAPQTIAQKSKATLLFYWLGEQQSYLWAIRPGKISCFKLAKASEIEPLVKEYRDALEGSEDVLAKSNENGKKLYAMLVAPAENSIEQNSRIILLPDLGLNGLNFETLIVPGGPSSQPHFWIEDVTLTTAPSLTLLALSAARAASNEKRLLLLGNTDPAGTDFAPLQQAAAEMKKVESHFSNREVFEGKQATPQAYLQSNPGKFSYLHFVTHGTASLTRPLESAVILSQQNGAYKLYARDIVQHPLHARLVTISACEGSGKRTYSGEGLVGLSWAFLRAGAHNVIGALWDVSDTSSTPQLMDSMYYELSRGKDPAAALRNAKLSLLNSSTNNVFKKPFYWAPFQLYAGS